MKLGEGKKVILGSESGEEAIRSYLLGTLSDEEQMKSIESQLLVSDEFAEAISIREDSLIEEYLDDKLATAERISFERGLTLSEDLKGRLRLISGLRKIASKDTSMERPTVWSWYRALRLPILKYAVASVLVIIVGVLGWRIVFYRSDADRGTDMLRTAYAGKRSFESRPTIGFDYAPLVENRGPETVSPSNKTALIEAKALILKGAAGIPDDPANLHALGLLYFVEHDFDAALAELQKAISSSPKNARVFNDLGSVHFEVALRSEDGERYEQFSTALTNFDTAISLDSDFPEALFNRALVLQRMGLHVQSLEAWQKYLENDPSSLWADEARKNQADLRSSVERGSTDPENIFKDFMDAVRARDEEKAWKITKGTRELITGAMVLMQLSKRFAAENSGKPGSENSDLEIAIDFLGKIEKKYGSDNFAAEFASFLAVQKPQTLQIIAEANGSMDTGHRHVLSTGWDSAMTAFESAKKLHLRAGNKWQAEIAEYQICYVLTQLRRIPESNERLFQLRERSEARGYKWLSALSSNWLANNFSLLAQHARAVEFGVVALEQFRQIADSYWIQNTANNLTRQYCLIGNQRKAFSMLGQAVINTDNYYRSPRQTSRNLLVATESLYTFGQYAGALAFAREQLYYAEQVLNDKWLTHTARINLAIIHSAEKNFEQAMVQINECFRIVESFEHASMRERERTRTTLILARVQRESGACSEAERNYTKVIDDYQASGALITYYEARKARLICKVASGTDPSVIEEITALIDLFELNRKTIGDGQDRLIFADREQSVYDIAAEYAFSKLNDNEKAFDFVERSRARALLDEATESAAEPLMFSLFRERIPVGAQILYYAVLPRRVLIWRFSAFGFDIVEVPIASKELTRRVREYNEILIGRGDVSTRAGDLYDLLIQPVQDKINPIDTVYIVADKVLFTLSFGSLRSPVTNRYLIEDFPIVYAPSASLYAFLSSVAEQKVLGHTERLFAMGNPSFSRRSNPGLKALPDATREASEIGKLYEEKNVLVESDATVDSIFRGMGSADVVHLAGHYVVDPKTPLKSRLLMSDRDITIEEIENKKLDRPKLVVLSACESGIENYYGGEGMVGGVRPFLMSRVPMVVGSQWAVDSSTTADLMIQFHRYRKEKRLTTANALRQSQIDLLHSSTGQANHPYFWAAFIAIGGSSKF